MACNCSSEAPVYLSASRGMCRICRKTVQVRYLADDEGVYLEEDDVIMFSDEPKEIGEECFLVIREERLLKANGLNKLEKKKDGE